MCDRSWVRVARLGRLARDRSDHSCPFGPLLVVENFIELLGQLQNPLFRTELTHQPPLALDNRLYFCQLLFVDRKRSGDLRFECCGQSKPLEPQLLGSHLLLGVEHRHPSDLDRTQVLAGSLLALDRILDGPQLSRKIDRLAFVLLDQTTQLRQLLVAESQVGRYVRFGQRSQHPDNVWIALAASCARGGHRNGTR